MAWAPKPSAILHTARANTGLDYQRRQYDAFKTCPNCGASKVRTVSKVGFVPTGAIAPAEEMLSPHSPYRSRVVRTDQPDPEPVVEKAITPPRKMGRMQRRMYEAGRRSAR